MLSLIYHFHKEIKFSTAVIFCREPFDLREYLDNVFVMVFLKIL